MKTDAEIVARHINELIPAREPFFTEGAEAVGPTTVALTGSHHNLTYRREYTTEGYSSLDRAAPERILIRFDSLCGHVFSLPGAVGAPERKPKERELSADQDHP